MEIKSTMNDIKEIYLVNEIINYLPSLSDNTKLELIIRIRDDICKQFCEKNKTCAGCVFPPSLCREIEKSKDYIKEKEQNK